MFIFIMLFRSMWSSKLLVVNNADASRDAVNYYAGAFFAVLFTKGYACTQGNDTNTDAVFSRMVNIDRSATGFIHMRFLKTKQAKRCAI